MKIPQRNLLFSGKRTGDMGICLREVICLREAEQVRGSICLREIEWEMGIMWEEIVF